MVKPDAFKNLGKILNAIYGAGFHVRWAAAHPQPLPNRWPKP
jgi:hypothetical protein